MGQEESLPPYPTEESVIIINDESVTSMPYNIPDPTKVRCIVIQKAHLKKMIELPSLTSLCYNSANLTDVPSCILKLIENCSELETLDLGFNKLKNVDKVILGNKSIKQLSLYHNNYTEIDLSKSHLLVADLGCNMLTHFPKLPHSLKSLSLDFNNISTFNETNDNMHRLSLKNNHISLLDPNVLFGTLKALDISYNQITELPNLISQFPFLRTIEASHNKITKVGSMPPLIESIDLSFNFLTDFPVNFNSLPKLKTANFAYNQIEIIPKLPQNLQSLIINDNNVSHFKKAHTSKLSYLLIRGNKLKKLPKFKENRLFELNFSSNLLTSLVNLDHLDFVRSIDLSDNRLSTLPEDLFKLPCLIYFSASRNLLKTLPDSVTDSKLVSLNLSQNNIEILPKLPTTLERLILAHCNLKTIDNFYDESNEELIEVYAPGNCLETIKFLPWFEKVILSRNLFKSIPEFNEKLKYLDLSHNILQNLQIIHSKHLEFLDLSYNYITNLDILTEKLEFLDLSYNESLNTTIDESKTPLLKSIDIVYTKINLLPLPHCFHVSSEISNEKFLRSNPTKDFGSISLIKGDQYVSQDYASIVHDLKPGFTLLTIVSGLYSGRGASIAARTAIKTFEDVSQISDKSHLTAISNKIAKALDDIRFYEIRSIGFAFLMKKILFVDLFGEICSFVVNKDGKIRIIMKGPDSAQFGPKSIPVEISNKFLFGNKNKVTHLETNIEENDKWIIFCSMSIIKYIPMEVIELIASNAQNPSDLSFDLRNIAYSYSQSENLTVCSIKV